MNQRKTGEFLQFRAKPMVLRIFDRDVVVFFLEFSHFCYYVLTTGHGSGIKCLEEIKSLTTTLGAVREERFQLETTSRRSKQESLLKKHALQYTAPTDTPAASGYMSSFHIFPTCI
jgi:hypothetical protein